MRSIATECPCRRRVTSEVSSWIAIYLGYPFRCLVRLISNYAGTPCSCFAYNSSDGEADTETILPQDANPLLVLPGLAGG
jgi:hypothetical protein